ncbi:MAG: DUF305 domain-containing protein [Pyrinomonadaceae bacterium]
MKKHEEPGKHDEMNMHEGKMQGNYIRFGLMIVLAFISMYVFMYAMVNVFANVYSSVNQFYMAGLMTAPMILIEIVLMGGMYPNKKINWAIIAFGVVALGGFWFLIRGQTAVSDRQFLRSMIPHHAGAILMCEKAVITDAEIQELCKGITSSQASEIDWMKKKLDELNKR